MASVGVESACARVGRHGMGAAEGEVAGWRAACWVDQALRGPEGAASLEAACRTLPGAPPAS